MTKYEIKLNLSINDDGSYEYELVVNNDITPELIAEIFSDIVEKINTDKDE